MSDPLDNKPPSIAKWLLSKCVPKSYLEEFLGDLQEMYEFRKDNSNSLNARLMYWVEAFHLGIGFISPSKILNTDSGSPMMFANVCKVAFRNALRQKQFTLLNITGLIVGIATCLLISLYVFDELTYDTFHDNKDRIYRINQSDIWGDWNEQRSNTGPNVAFALREDIPEFEEVTRIFSNGSLVVQKRTADQKIQSFNENRIYAADNNFFDVFSFEFVAGNEREALDGPDKMVITLQTAKRYFNGRDPIGKTLEVKQFDGSWDTFTISGVINDIPAKSHLKFDFLMSIESYDDQLLSMNWTWFWLSFGTYGLVHEGIDISVLERKLEDVPTKWAPRTIEAAYDQSFEEFTAGRTWKLFLQPIQNIYSSNAPSFNYFGPSGNPNLVRIFGIVGFFILILSSINFMNLSTARSSNRSKEVGIRKALGSERSLIIKQFALESILFVAVSTLFALLLIYFTIDTFNTIVQTQLSLSIFFTEPLFIAFLLVFIIVLGLLAGSYPAFYLSSFQPIQTLKGSISNSFKGKNIRNGLFILQFSISIALIICTFFVQRQLSYTATLDVGFDKTNILQVQNIEQFGFDTDHVKQVLSSNAAFTHVGKSFGVPPSVNTLDFYTSPELNAEAVQLNNLRTEAEYLDVLGLEFMAGRNFDLSRNNDKYGVILNERALEALEWNPNDLDGAIGKTISLVNKTFEFEVIGIVKDFNFHSLRNTIAPLVILHYQNDQLPDQKAGYAYYSMKLNREVVKTGNVLQQIVEDTKAKLKEIDGSVPIEFSFMDQAFENRFRNEYKMSSLLNIFTVISLIIACLGLFGLAAFSAEKRVKEMGIRKVLGARVLQIVLLFTSEFIVLISISILIASPFAYFFVSDWLQEFAYATTVNGTPFMIAALTAITIALGTIGYQALKIARQNPVDSLKSE